MESLTNFDHHVYQLNEKPASKHSMIKAYNYTKATKQADIEFELMNLGGNLMPASRLLI